MTSSYSFTMGDNAGGNGPRDHASMVEVARHALKFAQPPNPKCQLASSYEIL